MNIIRLMPQSAPQPILNATRRVPETAAIDDFTHSNAAGLIFEYEDNTQAYRRYQAAYQLTRRQYPDIDISLTKK